MSGSRTSCLLVLALLGLLACSARTDARPDLVLLSIDTLRADRLGCYGGEPGLGATLCDIASRGVRYAWAFSTAPSTAPSIASLLTSRYPAQHGVSELAVSFLDAEVTTLAEVLAEAGYTTAAFVSNPVLDPSRNLGQGFQVYDARMTRHERNRPALRERTAAATTDAALAWARVARRPWFMWIHYQDPHGPYEPPDAGPERDRPGDRTLALLTDHSGRGGIPAYQQLPGLVSVGAYQRRYAAEIRYLDAELGRLLAGLAALSPDAGILATADHGEAFGEDDYWFAHGHSVALDQTRVPLLWRPPGGCEPAVVTTPASLLDVAPTLLAAAGLGIPDTFDGALLPTTTEAGRRAAAGGPPRTIFAEHRLRIAVVTGSLHYARDREPILEPVSDRVTGGRLEALPPRAARLGPDGRAEPAPAGVAAETLDPLLDRFVEDSPGVNPRGARETPPGLQERLRALGYFE